MSRFRWLYILPIIWMIVSGLLYSAAPNLEQLVREHGQISIPGEYPSKIAKDILTENEGFDGSTILLVYHDSQGLSEEKLHQMEEKLNGMVAQLPQIPIERVVTPFDSDEQRELLISEDNTTLLGVLEVDLQFGEISHVREEIINVAKIDGMELLLTGSELIEEDVMISSEEGLARTEIITVLFLLIILFIVFRSVAAPFVPLITVGASYILSVALVSFMVDLFHFPVSNFTQIFIVAILFGIGTDYCILLLNRFKEELIKGENRTEAMKKTFRAVGPTVFYSALTGFIGFGAIGFANFAIYQSAVGVAVGIVVLVFAIWVWVPICMLLLGEKLFWPIRGQLENKENRFWGFLGKLSILRPGWTLVVLSLLILPMILTYNNQTSFNSLEEIDNRFDSVRAFHLVANQFGEGKTFPVKVVFENSDEWNTQEMLPYVELITRELLKINGVAEVRSATRPQGEQVEEFRIPPLVKEISIGLGEVNDGLGEIVTGIEEMANAVSESERELNASISDLHALVDGTEELRSGTAELATGLSKVQQGVAESAVGAAELQQGVSDIHLHLEQLAVNPYLPGEVTASLHQLAFGLQDVSDGLNSLAAGLTEAEEGQSQLVGATNDVQAGMVEVNEAQEEILAGYIEMRDGMAELATSLNELATGITEIEEGLEEINALVNEIALQPANPLEGFYVPKEVLAEEELDAVWETYLTPNKKVASFDVILAINPYSNEAMELVTTVEERVQIAVKRTPLEEERFSVGGLPSSNRDLSMVSDDDFFRTATIMLAGIFIVLIILLRSFIMPIYIIASLILTYLTSISFTEWLFVTVLGYTGITWAVPFFGFVMLMALGVDYSIFLMGRFSENVLDQDIPAAMMHAMKQIGTVILSAAIILAGTFGAMMPSGVLSLMQIGTLVLTGLLIYAVIMLPLFIPMMVTLFGDKNWLPWKGPKQ